KAPDRRIENEVSSMSPRLFARAALGLFLVFALGLTACNRDTSADSSKPVKTTDPTPVDPGDPLFDVAKRGPRDTGGRIQADPVVVQLCHLTIIDKEDVPSQVDGVVAFIGVEVAPAEQVQDKRDVWEHPRTKKLYRRLKPGEQVARGQDI